MPIHGYVKSFDETDPLNYYGSDRDKIKSLSLKDKSMADVLVEGFPYTKAEVVWAVREEMARTVEDFLARRSRFLLLDARKSMKQLLPWLKLLPKNWAFGGVGNVNR